MTLAVERRSMVVMERKAVQEEGPFEHTDPFHDPERMLECACYGECLSKAVEFGWYSWTCGIGACARYVECSPQQKRDDMFGLLKLLSEVNLPSLRRNRE